ncbi:MAG: hypothetical protein ACM3X1_07820 [Ignavibacteriales bacterium]
MRATNSGIPCIVPEGYNAVAAKIKHSCLDYSATTSVVRLLMLSDSNMVIWNNVYPLIVALSRNRNLSRYAQDSLFFESNSNPRHT